MTEGGESRPLLLRRYSAWVFGAAGVAVAVFIGAIDQRHTAAKIPTPFSLQQYEEIARLDSAFERRAWIYAGAAALAMAIATAVGVARAKTVTERRRVFGEAGVVGILLAFAGIIVRWQVHSPIEPSTASVLLPSGVLLAIAGVGGTISWLQGGPAPVRRPSGASIAALVCTAATVVCALAYGIPQNGDCSGASPPPPAWTDDFARVGYVTGLAAIVLAFVVLTNRRWFVALVCFVVNTAAFFYAVIASGAGC